MKSSCLLHGENEPLLILRKSHVDFCEGDVCAAAMVSYFEYWHNIKMEQGCMDEEGNIDLYQFHTTDEIINGIMRISKEFKKIKRAREYLVGTGIISEYHRPKPKFKFDNTIYYVFHPEIFNNWFKSTSKKETNQLPKSNNNSCQKAVDPMPKSNNNSCQKAVDVMPKSMNINRDYITEITKQRLHTDIIDNIVADVVGKTEKTKTAKAKNSADAPSKKETATRLQNDWTPSEVDIQFCAKERPDLNVMSTADSFRDYWISKPGVAGKKLDWAATWRNWVRSQHKAQKPKYDFHNPPKYKLSAEYYERKAIDSSATVVVDKNI